MGSDVVFQGLVVAANGPEAHACGRRRVYRTGFLKVHPGTDVTGIISSPIVAFGWQAVIANIGIIHTSRRHMSMKVAAELVNYWLPAFLTPSSK